VARLDRQAGGVGELLALAQRAGSAADDDVRAALQAAVPEYAIVPHEGDAS
jgi:hypothetical protein